jgi:hypothetical protein
METIQITKERAIKAYENAGQKGKKLLEDLIGKKELLKNVQDRILSFDDVLKDLGIDKDQFAKSCETLTADEVAYRQAKLIAQALNEGWTPDWNNENEIKYLPWFNMGSASGVGFSYDGCGGWVSDSVVGSLLCYRSKELAEYAGNQFLSIYKELFTL